MSASTTCTRCGSELAASGVCPRCVLKLGLGESTPDEPALSAASRPGSTGPTTPPGSSSYRGPRFTPPTVAELAPCFPQLEILELIGHGGMGAVYKARQPSLDRIVAVKILPADAAADPAFAERFTREARALARLSHPHIVAVHDFGLTGDLYYFVMEYVEGANLRQLLRSGEMTPLQALAIVPQMCEALQFAHDEGVVHRDIKPENVLVDRRGRVKIADFGLAKLLLKATSDFTLTSPEQVMGTPHYMAPEQMERPLTVDHRADIYSLGVVFYELLTGELPLGRFSPPSEVAAVDARLDEVVFKSLAKEPSRRYQQASAVGTDVEAIRRSPRAMGAAPPLHRAPPSAPAAVTGPWHTPPPPAPLPPKQLEEPIDWPTVESAVRWPAYGLIMLGLAYLLGPFLVAGTLFLFQGSPRQAPPKPAAPFQQLSVTTPRAATLAWSQAHPQVLAAPTISPPIVLAQSMARAAPLWFMLIGVFGLVIPVTVGGLLVLGGLRMLQLQAYGLAIVASILAILSPVGFVAVGVFGFLFMSIG